MSTALPEAMTGSRLLTFKQAKELLSLNERFLWFLVSKKAGEDRIPTYKVGRRRMFKYDQIMFWLEGRRS